MRIMRTMPNIGLSRNRTQPIERATCSHISRNETAIEIDPLTALQNRDPLRHETAETVNVTTSPLPVFLPDTPRMVFADGGPQISGILATVAAVNKLMAENDNHPFQITDFQENLTDIHRIVAENKHHFAAQWQTDIQSTTHTLCEVGKKLASASLSELRDPDVPTGMARRVIAAYNQPHATLGTMADGRA